MQVRRYEAMDMTEAIRQVKQELGPDAVILSSRKIRKGKDRFGMFGRPVVEVTAAAGTPAAVEGNGVGSNERTRNNDPSAFESGRVRRREHEPMKAAAISMGPVMNNIAEIRRRLDGIALQRPEPGANGHIADDMRELKSMISFLVDFSIERKEAGEHKNFRALARYLKEQGVAPEFVRALVEEIIDHAGGGPVPHLKTLAYLAATRMRGVMTFGGWLDDASIENGRRVVALVGPTGVGKTTTVAKLAAGIAARGKKVALITIDTFRIAAVEQLKIYAKILNVPLEVVLDPGGMKRALHALRHVDVVLVDTAGRSQRDLAQIGDLAGFIAAAPEIETRLTLSAAASEKQLQEAIANFSRIRVDGLIFTKLDEAVTLGAVYNQSVRSGLPISYFATGQRVPEDIEEASAKRLINGIFKTEKRKTNNHTSGEK